AWRDAKSAATRSAMRRSRPRRPRRVGGVESATAPASAPATAPRQDPSPARSSATDALLVGRPVDFTRGGEKAHVRLAELERVNPVGCLARALMRPRLDAVGRRIEQLVEPLDLVRL